MAKALPGQKINLRLELPEGSTGTDFLWNLPGNTFKDFTGVKEKGELKQMETNDLNQQEVYFYWSDSGSKNVSVTYKERGMQHTVDVTIDVTKPTATLTALAGASLIGLRPEFDPNYEFLYVDSTQFTGAVSIPPEFGDGGVWSFVQLATLNCSKKLDPSQDDPTAKQDGGTYFDGGDYPYAGNFDVGMTKGTVDSPQIKLKTDLPVLPVGYRFYQADLTFVMYLMFTPPGSASRQVPLLSLPWSWSDAAIYDDEDPLAPWKKAPDQRNPAVEAGTSVENSVHPHWSDSTDNHKDF